MISKYSSGLKHVDIADFNFPLCDMSSIYTPSFFIVLCLKYLKIFFSASEYR